MITKRTNRFLKNFLFILTAVGVLSMSTQIIYTAPAAAVQTGTQKTEDNPELITSEDALLSSVNNMLENAEQPLEIKPKLPKAAATGKFNWDSPQLLKGIYSSADLYFTLPKYWDTKYVMVQIEYRVSQLIDKRPCILTFSINKQPFYSCSITYKNNDNNLIYALIPSELLKNDRQNRSNTLTVSGYARLFNEQGCVDEDSNTNWITFSESSGVEVGYNLIPSNNRLDFYPYPFMSSEDRTGSKTVIAVADAAQNQEVATAMKIMAGLSKSTGESNNLTVSSWEEAKKGKSGRRIVVGLVKDMPAELSGYIQPYVSKLPGQVMLLCASDDKGPLLIIAAEEENCLQEAGYFLGDGERVGQVESNITFIKKGTAEIRVNAQKQSEIKADRYTLQEMTGGGFEFIGPFRQEKVLFLPLATDYTLSSAGKVTVYFRYSKNLDFRRSMLTVYWGDIPVGSKKLSLENADNDELTFFMPADVVGTHAASMKFAFDLELPELYCTTRHEKMPWGYITKDTVMYLPENNTTKLSFGSRPAPFQKSGRLNEVMLVLPDKPSSNQLTLLGRTLALYSGTDPYGSLKVIKAGEFNEQEANYNIITSGTPRENKFIAALNGSLYFKYDSSGVKFQTNEKLILTTDYAQSIGTLQLLKSPYSEGRALLVLTGPDESSMKRVARLVSNEKLSWNLKDNFVLIDTKGDTKAYLFQNNEVQEKKPTLIESVVENRNSLLFALAGTSVMLVLFLAMLLILLRMRRKKS